MNKKPPLLLGIVLVIFSAVPILAQTQEKSITRLKLENNRLRAIAEDKKTSAEIRELNHQLLVKNETLLREAIKNGIASLEDYLSKNADLLDENDRKEINEKIEAHKYDLAQLRVKEIPKSKTEKISAESVAVKQEEPKVVPVNFAESFKKKPEKKEEKENSKSISSAPENPPVPPTGDGSIKVELPANPSNKKRVQLKLKVDAKITKLTLWRNGVESAMAIPPQIKANGGYKTFIYPIDLYAGENKFEIVDTFDNSHTSGEFTLNCPEGSCPALKQEEVDAANRANTFDWGRVRGYFTSGIVLSKDRDVTSTEKNNFSKPDIYLDFTLDKNYVTKRFENARPLGIFDNVNTFFSARLTSIGVSNSTGTTAPPVTGANACNTAECTTFLTSEKVARMEAGIYAPLYLTRWNQISPAEDSETNKWGNALFFAPLVKGGIQTIVGDRRSATAEARRFGGDDVFNFYSFGAGIGHFKLYRDKRNASPEIVSYLNISAGRFENFEYLDPDGAKDKDGNLLIRRRPWRIETIGRLKVPGTDFIVGFDGNFGKGPDDLRFIFGYRFNIGTMMQALKIGRAQQAAQEQAAAGEKPKANP